MEHNTPRPPSSGGQLITYREAARRLGLSTDDVRRMVDDGQLWAVSVGGKPHISAPSIRRVLGCDTTFGAHGYSELSFEQYVVQALNRGVKRAHSRTTENYRCVLSLVARELGDVRIAELGEDDLRRAFRRLESRYATGSLRLAHTVTRCILREAYESGDIPTDPTRRWEAPKSTKPRRADSARIYSAAELEAIFRAGRAFDAELYTMFAVLECTGMRPGELLALEWSSYDSAARTLHIYQTVTRRYGTICELGKAAKSESVLSVPKSAYSVRTLRLSDTAISALDAWRETQCAKAHGRFIFPGRNGGFRSLSGAEKKLQQFREASGISGVTFYKFRHTMCTRLALEKYPISLIQRIMGDNSPDVITRVYTHIYEDDALRAMDEYFASRNVPF